MTRFDRAHFKVSITLSGGVNNARLDAVRRQLEEYLQERWDDPTIKVSTLGSTQGENDVT